MDFEWDEAKSEACFEERGFDFAYAARAFFDPNRLVQLETRYSYGKELSADGQDRAQAVCGRLHAEKHGHAHHLGAQSQPATGQAL